MTEMNDWIIFELLENLHIVLQALSHLSSESMYHAV